MSQALLDAAAEARLIAFNLMLEAASGGRATAPARTTAADMGLLAEAVLRGVAPVDQIRTRIAAASGRGLDPL
jgi:hypothetical protein